jgi:hypothetical protein
MDKEQEIVTVNNRSYQQSCTRKNFRFTEADLTHLEKVRIFYALKTQTDTIAFLLEKEAKMIYLNRKLKSERL